MSGASFVAAELKAADFEDSLLDHANFSGANLKEAEFKNASLIGADMTDTEFGKANLEDADLSGASLEGADLSKAKLNNTIFEGATFDESTRFPGDFDAAAAGASLTPAAAAQLTEEDPEPVPQAAGSPPLIAQNETPVPSLSPIGVVVLACLLGGSGIARRK